MTPEREERLEKLLRWRHMGKCWTLVRTITMWRSSRTIREEICTFHTLDEALKQHAAYIASPMNGYTEANLKLVPRALLFGEGLYL
jgi:hypothetical protein